jgi:hypothetical protein
MQLLKGCVLTARYERAQNRAIDMCAAYTQQKCCARLQVGISRDLHQALRILAKAPCIMQLLIVNVHVSSALLMT